MSRRPARRKLTRRRYITSATPIRPHALGLESDYHLLSPGSSTPTPANWSRCFAKGHHGVQLDAEAWDRLITWIDLNVPYHGTWHELAAQVRSKRSAAARRDAQALRRDQRRSRARPAPGPDCRMPSSQRQPKMIDEPPTARWLAVRRDRGQAPAAVAGEDRTRRSISATASSSSWSTFPPASSSWATPAAAPTNARSRG